MEKKKKKKKRKKPSNIFGTKEISNGTNRRCFCDKQRDNKIGSRIIK